MYNQKQTTGSGRQREIQNKKRISGMAYVTRSDKNIPKKAEPKRELSCKCYFSCKSICYERRLDLFKKFYDETANIQGTYLMNLISVLPVKRRRHGKYNDPSESHRQGTIAYTVPDGTGQMIRVCKSTFMNIFSISKMRLETIIRKKKMGETSFTDKRTCNKLKKFTAEDRNMVKQHILSIPRQESHYSRSHTTNEYLSPDLNKHRLFRGFAEKYPETKISYKFYSRIFREEFPNLKFHHPRTDTCRVCDRLTCEAKAELPSSTTAKQQRDLHQRKAERAFKLMKEDTTDSQMPGSQICCLSVDLQQVMFVPTLTHSDMFYLSQLSCYNLGIHYNNTNTGYMNVWNEGVAGRGANEVASCILRFLNSSVVKDKHVIIWTDNCAGQNKNKIMIFLYIYLLAHDAFDVIEHKFLVSGHSFMACDRDFAHIEKRKKVMKAMVPEDLHNVIRSAVYHPPFEIIDMEKHGFWNIKEAADALIDIKKLNISKAVMLRVERENPCIVKVKDTFSEVEPWRDVKVLKRNKSISDIKSTPLLLLPPENKITDNKKKSLTSMINFLEKEEHKEYYRNLLQI